MGLKSFAFFVILAAFNVVHSTSEQKKNFDLKLGSAMNLIVGAKYTLSQVPADWIPKPVDCADVFHMGGKKSGIYEIWPVSRVTDDKKSLSVYCDMDTTGGGWTVIQRRGDYQRLEDYFFKDWKSYKEGFGDVRKDFWLGNDNIFALTNQKSYSARFDLKTYEQVKRYALYNKFWIDDEDHNYKLHISGYSGDADDLMFNHNSYEFSTKDQDHDIANFNCASSYKGGWWYKDCHFVNLNGLYYKEKPKKPVEAVYWNGLEPLDWAEIKIRPKNFKNSFT